VAVIFLVFLSQSTGSAPGTHTRIMCLHTRTSRETIQRLRRSVETTRRHYAAVMFEDRC